METMREAWTDGRLDDLNHRVDELGRRMDARFDRVDDRFDRMEARFDGLQRTMIQVSGGVVAALLAGFAALIATQL